mmetsp:Transcript_34571/g.74986  ORF Transcript_34571/g.74986 Transcript_34571/m.74986 type:complete len:642 (-) Transcript_34571:215-2140(-)
MLAAFIGTHQRNSGAHYLSISTMGITKLDIRLLALAVPFSVIVLVGACPFAGNTGSELPKNHPDIGTDGLRRRLGLASLPSSSKARQHVADIVADAARRQGQVTQQHLRRSLQQETASAGGCFTRAIYENITVDIKLLSDGMAEIFDDTSRDQGHFMGGIVRLAAHDFMDYDPSQELVLGMDGCIDWDAADNAGLETIWCDNHGVCPLRALYDDVYAPLNVGRADFWVAAANAVISIASLPWTDTTGQNSYSNLELPFRYGRVDREDCSPPTVDSASRLPGAQGCSEVKRTFIDQMSLSWRDATALLGAHTLGFGHSQFSGHDGMWVDEEAEAVIFDKRYYEEILRRAWRQRNATSNNVSVQDWTWAGNNQGNPRFMLNADLCLAFDIDDTPDCCARIRQGGQTPGEVFCVDPTLNLDPEDIVGTIAECNSSATVRPEAHAAVNEFAVSINNRDRDDNGPFYEAFAAAWQRATEAGYEEGTLHSLTDTCDPTPEPSSGPSHTPSLSPTNTPTAFPTSPPTATPTHVPSASPTSSPTSRPTATPTLSPTHVPTKRPTNPPTPTCSDVDSFTHNGRGGPRTRTCDWAVENGRCNAEDPDGGTYGTKYCPVSCQMCGCQSRREACTIDDDCCSNDCRPNGTCRG